MDHTTDIINFGIARAISERRPIDYLTARLLAVELHNRGASHAALSAFVHDGIITAELEHELITLDVRSYPNADTLQRWACWLATYIANARRSAADGDAFYAFLSLQTHLLPTDGLQRRFAGAYAGSFSNKAMADSIDQGAYDVVPLFGRYHVFAR